MPTYAIGDIHGCYREFKELLKKIKFSSCDELWLTGDLVNRGKYSLDVLKWCIDSPNVISVLGNHDLLLLGIWKGILQPREQDTFDEIIQSKQCDNLCNWLLNNKLVHYSHDLNFVLVHAGIPPHWSLNEALKQSLQAENALQSINLEELLAALFLKTKTKFYDIVETLKYFTFMRMCSQDGDISLNYSGPPCNIGQYQPWYRFKNHRWDTNIVFGHWSAIGGGAVSSNVFAIDTGCVWGKSLTALRLEDQKFFYV